MIVVEGPDGSGKTTLVNKLAKDLGVLIANDGPRDELHKTDVRARTYRALADAVGGAVPVRIHDRLFYSELVYGKVLRGHCVFSLYEEMYVRRILAAANIPTILCAPPLNVIRENLEETDHIEGVVEKWEKLEAEYRKVMVHDSSILGVPILYDYTGHFDPVAKFCKYSYILDRCGEYINTRRQRAWQ